MVTEIGRHSLVVSGAYDRRLRLWDISSPAIMSGQATMLGTLSEKVRYNDKSHVFFAGRDKRRV